MRNSIARRPRLRLIGLVLGAGLLLPACMQRIGSRPAAAPSHALAAPDAGLLRQQIGAVRTSLPPGESAYWLLSRSDAALTARASISDAAVSSLDVQYFIWHPDETGRLLMHRLLAAADRGVRVRFLLDDFAANGLDHELVALDHHPSIEVRIFNPWRHRRFRLIKAIEFIGRWGHLNHRMHNKIYVADNLVAILGGRNVGNRYFGFYDHFMQNDLDLMTAGPIVRDVAASFDLFWNSSLAYAVHQLPVRDPPDALLEMLRAEFDRVLASQRVPFEPYLLSADELEDYWREKAQGYMQGPGVLHYDLPFVYDTPPEQLYEDFREFIGSARREVLISSPYFVPEQAFVDQLGALVDRGVQVSILTNSLASNNHTVAHTGYRHWRRAVLRRGVQLFEFRYDAESRADYAIDPDSVRILGLHSKSAVVDGKQVLLGSPNIDPRSMRLNTELGVIIDDPELASLVAGLIRRDMRPANAWQVFLRDGRWLTWTSDEGTVKRQPANGFRQRGTEFFLNLLPLKGQL